MIVGSKMAAHTFSVPRTQENFIRTFTGRKFWPLDPRADEIDIRDVAHALSLACRWSGHTYCFYSVAEHSVRVSQVAEKMALANWAKFAGDGFGEHARFSARLVALWGLLHDASEAYLCDLPTPLKHAPGIGPLYQAFEVRLMDVIADRFELPRGIPSTVKRADRILLNSEARDLMDVAQSSASEWGLAGACLPETIFPLDAHQAEVLFLRRFEALTKALELERQTETV